LHNHELQQLQLLGQLTRSVSYVGLGKALKYKISRPEIRCNETWEREEQSATFKLQGLSMAFQF